MCSSHGSGKRQQLEMDFRARRPLTRKVAYVPPAVLLLLTIANIGLSGSLKNGAGRLDER